MGRKSKPPVRIKTNGVKTEVSPQDGLPAFRRFMDVLYTRQSSVELTRVFFVESTEEEIADYLAIRESGRYSKTCVIASKTPTINSKTQTPLYDACINKGFSHVFSEDMVRLVIHWFGGREKTRHSMMTDLHCVEKFIQFFLDQRSNPETLILTSISRKDWEAYQAKLEQESTPSSKPYFGRTTRIFASYSATSLNGWLKNLVFRPAYGHKKLAYEHTSELAEADAAYSDAVMYQILAHCLDRVQRGIGYLKRYESITERDMPKDWIWAGREARFIDKSPWEGGDSDITLLLKRWLSSEASYQTVIDQCLLELKAGIITKNKKGCLDGGTLKRLAYLASLPKHQNTKPLVLQFRDTVCKWHGIGPTQGFLKLYQRRELAREPNLAMDQIAWGLSNLLMIAHGVNKEVIVSIPSRTPDGKSILERTDTIFPSASAGRATESELYGFKNRTGTAPAKIIPIVIARSSPVFKWLQDYERYVKVDFNGPFFEFQRGIKWGTASFNTTFADRYPIYNDHGELLRSISTRRFRKVFATAKLLELIKECKTPNELAENIRESLTHGNLDVTLSNYLLKSSVARSAMDLAIVAITSQKLEEGLQFKGKIALSGQRNKKKVFLCDCENPTKPTHNLPIADECRHYDMCLGCERSTVMRFHLPYICKRIRQYENEREGGDPAMWSALYENKWMIAHDALEKYATADKKNGKHHIEEAWKAADEGRVSLPPILSSGKI